MKRLVSLITIILILTSCDCLQGLTGVVLDKETKQPLADVGIGKYEKEDPSQPYSRREYSDSTGNFDYSSISGGPFGCPDLELFFSKKGYKTSKLKFNSYSVNDTIYLEKIK